MNSKGCETYYLYKTPRSLRAYSQVFLNLFPILYAPYFAHISKESNSEVGYAVAILYSLVLVTLDNIQEDLENPYDSVGENDMKLTTGKDLDAMLKSPPE